MRLLSGLTALCAAALFSSQTFAAPLILATKSFTEQHILSAMTVQYLQKKAFQVQPQTNIATVISRNAMINKQIDMTWSTPVRPSSSLTTSTNACRRRNLTRR
jgi:osmoprotectant transport system substrate-binding protein